MGDTVTSSGHTSFAHNTQEINVENDVWMTGYRVLSPESNFFIFSFLSAVWKCSSTCGLSQDDPGPCYPYLLCLSFWVMRELAERSTLRPQTSETASLERLLAPAVHQWFEKLQLKGFCEQFNLWFHHCRARLHSLVENLHFTFKMLLLCDTRDSIQHSNHWTTFHPQIFKFKNYMFDWHRQSCTHMYTTWRVWRSECTCDVINTLYLFITASISYCLFTHYYLVWRILYVSSDLTIPWGLSFGQAFLN